MTAEQDALAEAEARLRQHDDDGYCGPGCPDGDRLRAVVEALRLKARNERLVALLRRALDDIEGQMSEWDTDDDYTLVGEIAAAIKAHEEGR